MWCLTESLRYRAVKPEYSIVEPDRSYVEAALNLLQTVKVRACVCACEFVFAAFTYLRVCDLQHINATHENYLQVEGKSVHGRIFCAFIHACVCVCHSQPAAQRCACQVTPTARDGMSCLSLSLCLCLAERVCLCLCL